MIRIKQRTIEEIIELWNSDLELHVAAFHEQCAVVQQWDMQLTNNLQHVVELQQQCNNIQSAQNKLCRILDNIKTNQIDLLNMLNQLESKTDSMQRTGTTNDEINRSNTYELAEDVDSELTVLTNNLNNTIQSINTIQQKQYKSNNPVVQIIKILHTHTQTLQWLDQTSTALEQKLLDTTNKLQSVQQNNMNVSNEINNANNRGQYTSSLRI